MVVGRGFQPGDPEPFDLEELHDIILTCPELRSMSRSMVEQEHVMLDMDRRMFQMTQSQSVP